MIKKFILYLFLVISFVPLKAFSEVQKSTGNPTSTKLSLLEYGDLGENFEAPYAQFIEKERLLIIGKKGNILIYDIKNTKPISLMHISTDVNNVTDVQTSTLLNNGKVLITGYTYKNIYSEKFVPFSVLFDPIDLKFKNTKEMKNPRRFYVATLLPSGKVLISGGKDFEKFESKTLGSVEIFDPLTNDYSMETGSITPRFGHHAVLDAKKQNVYFFGGFTKVVSHVMEIENLNLQSNKVEQKGILKQPILLSNAYIVLPHNKIMFLLRQNKTLTYDFNTGTQNIDTGASCSNIKTDLEPFYTTGWISRNEALIFASFSVIPFSGGCEVNLYQLEENRFHVESKLPILETRVVIINQLEKTFVISGNKIFKVKH